MAFQKNELYPTSGCCRTRFARRKAAPLGQKIKFTMLENQWHYINRPDLGLMNTINNMIHELDISDPNSLPDIQRGSTVIVGSDYSGQHAASDYESQAFILADIEFCQEWGAIRRLLRKIFLRDGRRISYKALRDKKRKEMGSSLLLTHVEENVIY